MSLSRDDFRSAHDRPRVKKVSVPELDGDGHAYVRVLSGKELEESKALEREHKEQYPDMAAAAALVVYGVCDDSGKRVFSDSDIEVVLDIEFPVLMRLAEEVLELNGLTESSQEDTAKNSESVPV